MNYHAIEMRDERRGIQGVERGRSAILYSVISQLLQLQ